MRVRVLSSLDELSPELRARASYPAVADFFASLDWFELLHRHGMNAALPVRIYLVGDDADRPMAALYCCVPRRRKLAGLSNFYTVRFSIAMLDAAAPTPGIVRSLAAFMAAERPRWYSIELRCLRADDPASSGLAAQLRSCGLYVYHFPQYQNWFAPVAGTSFSQYWSARPGQLVNTVTRRLKKARKQGALEMRIVTRPGAELEAAIEGYQQVYGASWKKPEPFPQFMPRLMRRCAELGVLRLGEVRVNGEPAAAQVWVVSDERAMIYKLAYDERFAELSVGSILSTHLFEHVLDTDHVRELDYGVGGEAYKRDWMTSMRELRGMEALNPRTLRGAALAGIQLVKPMLAPLRDKRR
jgi:hypothetical protein